MIGVLAFAMALAATLGVTQTPAGGFPDVVLGSWADDLQACEPEFTGGFRIEKHQLSLYDGPGHLVRISPAVAVDTPSGPGQTFTAEILYEEGGDTEIATDRFTVVGKWLYHSLASKTMSEHLSEEYRLELCSPGSTDG